MKDLREKKKEGDVDNNDGINLVKILSLLNPISFIKIYYKNIILLTSVFIIINLIVNPHGIGQYIHNWITDFRNGINGI